MQTSDLPPPLRLAECMWRPLATVGVLLGTLFFAASLTPSLIPRTPMMQGVLAGTCMAAGYALGVMLCWAWRYLELPLAREDLRRRARRIIHGLCLLLALCALWRAPHWQNMVRGVFHMPMVGHGVSLQVGVIALVVFVALLAFSRFLRAMARRLSRLLARVFPRRVANALGVLGVVLLVVALTNQVVLRIAMHLIDSSFRQADALIPPDTAPPTEWDRSGGPDSLIAWDNLGRMGRRYVASTPTAEAVATMAGAPSQAPLRVYAGLPSAPSAEERAQLALAELKRVGGFSRAALIVITPTGTGWVDPAAIEPVEYLYRGDIASVAMQYSYLSSPLSLIIEPEYGRETSQALFRAVYGYWRTLPRDKRPRLYLHGLSLGAMNSERSLDLFDVLGDPPHGALWSGPPFAASHWRAITLARNAGTPAWLPQFRDGAFVRFMNQHGSPVPADAPWGVMRIMYLQYASDAVTFFDYRDAFRSPIWLYPTRGPDVAPQMRWYPVVSMAQLALDMILANEAPMGYGHVYAPSHYVDAWLQVTGVEGWSPQDLSRLKRTLDERRAAELSGDENEGGG
ncbi:alpha/beta-hydrolase family protein [Lysobacter sp. LF1]|uniref:Alpha/beta-hydrolase family protein n=1 Tax=Lysobacter stagni TaxID=3045172 RepID=A0ABT6XI49_9GAMM|nr:alpha/beta-hydrolase family protein [Lysobacter sp. LF1]MDI9239827.1 alpha/beta-hydrolase family protein [Lysobacter sp. LF1]